jgi:hypothetical protein
MQTNPNIILSGNQMAQPRLPDVNAMMQTRTAGLENIYGIEQQRAAQAQAAQKEQAAAQETAMIKALLPAYTYGIQTGDMAGAGNLVPPEIRPQVQQYIDALTGKSPEEVKSALIGSLSSLGQTGQEALAAIQRAETTGIQREQNVLSRDRLNLDRQKAALDARGEGEWELKEGEGGFFWTNPRSRQVIRAEVTGGAAPAPAPAAAPGPTPIPAPDVVTPRMPAPGAPAVEAPISTERPPAEFRPKAKAGATDQTQEERRRAASVRYTVKNADRVTELIDKNPAAFGQGADEFLLSIIPFDMGKDFLQFTQDADREQVYYRMTQLVATLLRLETGAAYTNSELATESASFMQKYGDEPATARDKIDALQDRVTSAVGSTGRAWTPQDQAEYDAAMMALEAVKDRLYPAGGGGEGGAAEELPEGATTSNW